MLPRQYLENIYPSCDDKYLLSFNKSSMDSKRIGV